MRKPADAVGEVLGADLEGVGELYEGSEAGLALAALEQGDLGPVQAGAEA